MPVESPSLNSIDNKKNAEPKINMAAFRREMKLLIADQYEIYKKSQEPAPPGLSKKERQVFALRQDHEFDMFGLLGLNMDDLTEADAIMWGKVYSLKKGRVLVSENELAEYQKGAEWSLNRSRISFARYIVKLYRELWS